MKKWNGLAAIAGRVLGGLLPSTDRLLLAFALFFLISALLATQSRMGVVSGLAGMLVVILLRLSQITQTRFAYILAPALLIVFFALFGAGLADRFINILMDSDIRFSLYDQVARMIGDRPFTGFGAGSFNLVFPLYHDLNVPTDRVWDRAHSTYLELWVDMGVIVGSMPMLIIAILVWPLFRKSLGPFQLRTEAIAVIGATVTIALHSLFDFSMEIEAVVFLYLAILATGVGAFVMQSDKTSARYLELGGVNQPLGIEKENPDRKGRRKSGVGRQGKMATILQRPRLYFPQLPAVVYAIGDVHGRLDLLERLERKIFADAQSINGEKWVILLGDLIDRGPQSAQVIDHLQTPMPRGFNRFCVAGNHEAMMQAFLARAPNAERWIGFGGSETLRSYGLSDDEIKTVAKGGQSSDYLLSGHIPVEHIQFLESLPDAIVTPRHVFLHIGMDESNSIAPEVDLAARLLTSDNDDEKDVLIIHGHRIVPEPRRYGNQVNVDTGAYETGCLSAVKLMSGENLYFLDSGD